MLAADAANAYALGPTTAHNWSGFGESTSLRANSFVWLRIHFLGGDTPTAKAAVWTYLVLDRTMAHPVLMDRDIRTPLKHSIHATLPPRTITPTSACSASSLQTSNPLHSAPKY